MKVPGVKPVIFRCLHQATVDISLSCTSDQHNIPTHLASVNDCGKNDGGESVSNMSINI